MAYVPPHRRVQEGSSSSVQEGSSSSVQEGSSSSVQEGSSSSVQEGSSSSVQEGSSSSVQEGSSSLLGPAPFAPPSSVRNNFRKWFAVDGNGDTSNLSLEFKPFDGKSPAHLRDKKLYTLYASPLVNVENNMRSLAINEVFPWKKICERFFHPILENFHNVVQSYIEESKPNDMKPTFLIRFGKILFRGCGLTCHERITTDMLEKALKAETSFRESIMKIFYTNIQKNILEALEEKILAGLQTSEFEEKENYFIQVEDNLCPDAFLRLICVNNSEDGGHLQLKKIQIALPVYFIADISCVNKLMDLRLSLFTKNYLYVTELGEKMREGIEGIVKSACIENGSHGGLHWPLGNSVGNRFKVVSSWHRKVTTIVGKLWTIKLLHVSRANFETSSGEVTNEVNLKLTSLTKYLRDQVQWSEENIMNELEDILEWVWTECL